MRTPSLLLFDLGGVLVRNVGFERLNALLPAALDVETLKSQLLASPSFRAFELGLSAPEDFAESFVSELNLTCSPKEFLAEFEGWPQGFYPGATELLAKLRARYKLACLSNSNSIHWKRFNGFREHFDIALSSHILNLIKPDLNCFEKALECCGVKPEQVLFFDDAIANVKAARSCGIQALHVQNFDEVQIQVKTLALLPADA